MYTLGIQILNNNKNNNLGQITLIDLLQTKDATKRIDIHI